MSILYQGVPGSYSSVAAQRVEEQMQKTYTIQGCVSFRDVRDQVATNPATLGVLPIENSYAGSIHENVYKFLHYDHRIIGEYDLAINHCLLSHETEIRQIKRVYSHRQAIAQCEQFLTAHNIEPIKHDDTAGAAQYIAMIKEPGSAAIASSLAGELYNLTCVQKNIQDQAGNTTKFIIIANKSNQLPTITPKGKVSILFGTRHIPAALYKCLGAFATNTINLTKIESMPSQADPFTYLFFISFEGHLIDPNIQHMIEELRFFTTMIKILGEY